MKTLTVMLAIKLLVAFPIGQQPDSAARARGTKSGSSVKGKVPGKAAKEKVIEEGGLLYRILLRN